MYDTVKYTDIVETRISISGKPKTINTHVQYYMQFPWKGPEMNMLGFREFLKTQNLHKYRYDDNVSGCLTWITGVIDRCEHLGHLAVGTTRVFKEYCDDIRAGNEVHWIPEDRGVWFT